MPSAAVLGKRKRKPAQRGEGDTDAAALEDAQAIFRKHFEAQFAPIDSESAEAAAGNKKRPGKGKSTASDDEDSNGVEDMRSDSESDDDADEWGGISGEDDIDGDEEDGTGSETSKAEDEQNNVEVIDYSKPLPTSVLHPSNAVMSKREMRAFLSSKPPDTTSTDSTRPKPKPSSGGDEDPQNEDSRSLLADDLALQRLISESHILSASNPFNSIGSGKSAGGGRTFVEGRTRALTTDLRLQKLGSKESIFTQRKMPMGMRQGINAAKESREVKRRREAKENGIILEKPVDKGASSKKKKSKGRGGVAVDMPGMGRFSNGELKLSKREVRAVEMEGMRPDSGKRRRRRR